MTREHTNADKAAADGTKPIDLAGVREVITGEEVR
jgi:hypothetical protein